MRIDKLEYKYGIFLAPMAGVTDLSFRTICRPFGVELTYSEMISAKGMYYNDRKTKDLLKTNDVDSPIAVQIFGSEPEIMGKVSHEISKRKDVSIIDINMGCPVKKITRNNEGSALMKDIKLAEKIIEAVVENSSVPVTVKMRLGWDDKNINCHEFAIMAQEAKAKAVCIHTRTKEHMYSGTARWEELIGLKDKLKIPLIGNGDIFDYNSYLEKTSIAEVDGVMIARGAMGNPWIFNEIIDGIEKKEIKNVSFEEKRDTILKQFDIMIENKGQKRAVCEIRKHLGWYVKGLHNSTVFKDQVNRITDPDNLRQVTCEYFDYLINNR